MTGDDDFGDCAHSEQVCSYLLVEPHFGGSLIGGAGISQVNAPVKGDAHFLPDGQGFLLEFQVVGAGHVGETRAEFIEVGADERIRHQVDVVADYYEVAYVVVGIGGTGGVRYQQILHSKYFHDPDTHGYSIHGVAFITVETALHGEDLLPAQFARDEVAFVPDDCRDREAGDVLVGDDDPVNYLVCQLAQAAAEDYANLGLAAFGVAAYEGGGFIDYFKSGVHC